MARPNNGVEIENERALTRFICQRIYIASGLTYRQIEEELGIGAEDPGTKTKKKTGRTFSRYCQDNESKGRAASRNSLAQMIKNSIRKGWLKPDFLQRLGGNLLKASIPLDQLPSDSFVKRKSEIEALAAQLRSLRNECQKTVAILANLKFSKVDEQMDDNDPFWPDLYHFISEYDLRNAELSNSRFCPPSSLSEALGWLEQHLNSAHVSMIDGHEPLPKPKFKITSKITPDPQAARILASMQNVDE
jgi:hypothetical protein